MTEPTKEQLREELRQFFTDGRPVPFEELTDQYFQDVLDQVETKVAANTTAAEEGFDGIE